MANENDFTIEKLGILAKLNEIQLEQVKHNSKMDDILEKANGHHRTLYGINGDPGLHTVVDRLNENEKERAKHFWVLYPALALSLIKHGFDWMRAK